MKTVATHIAVVANPAGAKEESAALRKELADRQLAVNWLDTTEDDPGSGQAREALEAGADTLIACGGDGTVRACIEAVAGSTATLGVIPAGTGNLLARNVGIPRDIAEALDCAISGTSTTIDVGRLNDEVFAVMAGVGFDGKVMSDTSRDSKERFGALAYVATALRHLKDKSFRCEITVDGQQVFRGRAKSALVGNMGSIQGGINLFPDGSPNDGSLEVMVIRADGLWGWVWTAVAVLRRARHSQQLDRWSGTSGTISLDSSQPYQLDGDERDPERHFAFNVEPSSLTIRCKESS